MSLATGNKLEIGKYAEDLACDHLAKNGLRLIERNYTSRSGEIDLIMQHNKHIVFVEVRYRRSDRFGSGAESVDKLKQHKLIMTAQYYLQTHKKQASQPARFDVVSIRIENDTHQLEWITDAFQA